MAEHAFNFLADKFYDRHYGGVYWSVTADGTPKDTTKHTYNQGYFEAFSREFNPVSNEKLSENGVIAERTMNSLLHIMEAYTELYRADHFYEVFFDRSYHSLINLESYGHDIETSWLIDRACEVLQDKAYYDEMLPMIKSLADGAIKHGIDTTSKAMNNECENGITDHKKVWWVQAESVTGFYNAYTNEPDRTEYLEISQEIWDYINRYVIDKTNGEWIENINPDNSVDPT